MYLSCLLLVVVGFFLLLSDAMATHPGLAKAMHLVSFQGFLVQEDSCQKDCIFVPHLGYWFSPASWQMSSDILLSKTGILKSTFLRWSNMNDTLCGSRECSLWYSMLMCLLSKIFRVWHDPKSSIGSSLKSHMMMVWFWKHTFWPQVQRGYKE